MSFLDRARPIAPATEQVSENPRAVIGSNNPPPDIIVSARDAYAMLSGWLANNPAVVDEATARAATEVRDAAKSILKSLEAADADETKPMYDAWKEAKAKWKKPVDSITKLVGEVSNRLADYMIPEEAKRKAAAVEERRIAEEAKRVAMEKEAAEQQAILDARQGEFTDVGAATAQADIAFDKFKEAEHAAKIAEKDSDVRLRSRFGAKATSLRTVEVLIVDDPVAALKSMWPNETLEQAIMTAARAHRKANGALPPGVRRTEEKKL
jgi:hypothetical protein